MMHHIAPRCTITLHKAPFMSSNLYIPKTCKHCGNAFTARTTVTKYCGDTCAKKAYKARKRKEKVQATLTKDMQQQKEAVQIPKHGHGGALPFALWLVLMLVYKLVGQRQECPPRRPVRW